MKKLCVVLLIGILTILCVSCVDQNAENPSASLNTEQRTLLQNRSEEEIIASLSDKSYDELITECTDIGELFERYLDSEFFDKKYTNEYIAQLPPFQVPILYRELSLKEANDILPIQCLRKSTHLYDAYYAVYKTEYGCFYMFFGFNEEAGCYLAFNTVQLSALPNEAEKLEVGNTLADFYKVAPKYEGLFGENTATMLFSINDIDIVRGFHFTSEENKNIYGLPVNLDADPNKVIISDFFVLGYYDFVYSDISENNDYPKY